MYVRKYVHNRSVTEREYIRLHDNIRRGHARVESVRFLNITTYATLMCHSVLWYATQVGFCGVMLVPELGTMSKPTSNSTKEYSDKYATYKKQLDRNIASEVICVR